MDGRRPANTPSHSVDRLDEYDQPRLGASGIPDPNDPIPAIGFGYPDDLETNPSVIEGPLDPHPDSPQGDEVDEQLHTACYGLICSLAEHLPYMLSTYLDQVLQTSYLSAEAGLGTETNESRNSCLCRPSLSYTIGSLGFLGWRRLATIQSNGSCTSNFCTSDSCYRLG